MPANELEDLKAAWLILNRNLERRHTLALHQFKESKRARFRSGLRPLAIGQAMQLIGGANLAGLSAWFWANHPENIQGTVLGLLLHAYGVMLAAFAIRDLILIHQIDYGAPVVAMQKQIASLRAWHLRAGLWLAVAGCVVWLPLILLIPHFMGLRIWEAGPQTVLWLMLNGVVCLGLAGAAVYLFRRGQGRLAKSLRASAIGRSVCRAEAALEDIARFEQE